MKPLQDTQDLKENLVKEMQRGLIIEKRDNRLELVRYDGLVVKMLRGVSLDEL